MSLTGRGTLIPVYREILADMETPVSAYLKLAKEAAYSFLLESVEGQEKTARYSFLAKDPDLIFQSKDRTMEILQLKDGRQQTNRLRVVDSPLSFLREMMSQYRFVNVAGLPRFCGGLVGYIGYDTVRFFENLPSKVKDDLKLPDILLVLVKNLVIFDHINHTIKVVSCVEISPKDGRREKLKKYRNAMTAIDACIAQFKNPLNYSLPLTSPVSSPIKIKSNFSENQFKAIVKRAKKNIASGEIIQAVLSQRFQAKVHTHPFNIYRALRSVNPSPYMYYLNFGDLQLIGSSPELLVRCEDGIVETRPIAGTRARGKDDHHDAALMKDLLGDPKERAEHTMLVDLGRNDLGRICEKGTVRLSEFMAIEKYSHVMHIVSNVVGKLKKDKDVFDVLQATFPAGTVTGAPKIRAMEIIENLEKVSRGPYAGCIGYFSFSKNLDTCITIRTIVMKNRTAYIQAGAGIVADSNPKKEYLETVNKAKAQIVAITMAENQFA